MTMKKQKLFKASILYAIYGMILIVCMYLLSPLNRVRALNVTGNHYAEAERIINQSKIKIGADLWESYLDRARIERQVVNEVPEIKSVDVQIKNWNELELNVKEYRPVANLKVGNDKKRTAVLDNGTLFYSEKVPYADKPTLVNFEEGKLFKQLVDELAKVNDDVLALMADVELVQSKRNPLLIKIFMNDGNQVLASIPSLSERINLYPSLVTKIEEQTGVFDLEAGAHFIPGVSVDDIDYEQERSEASDSTETTDSIEQDGSSEATDSTENKKKTPSSDSSESGEEQNVTE